MTVKKRTTTPPDVAALKGIVQEQALKIVDLEKQLLTLQGQKDSAESSRKNASDRADRAEAVVAQCQDLMDSCPSCLPRMTTRKNTWGGTEEKEQDLVVRMGSWLGATRVA